jgi:hypothetical protein
MSGAAYPRIKELIREEMARIKRKRIPVRVFSNDIGLSPASLYNYADNDVTPNDEAVRKIAKYFKKTPAWLRGETDVAGGVGEKSSAEKIFESTVAGRTAEEQLELMSKWLEVVREHDSKK